MTVTVNVDGPDVMAILSKKIHQGIVTNLRVVRDRPERVPP